MTSAFTNKSIGRTLPIEVLEVLAVKICANVDLMKAEQRQFGESLDLPGVQIRRQNEPKERTNLETSDSTTTQFGPNTVKKIEADAGYDDVGPPMSTDLQSQALLKPRKTIALPTQQKRVKPALPTLVKNPKR
ncbi:hypothetical protein AAVH_02675 [Aphelenchoides avenae]|nr:hypothetical protein AAVH_02675 [Aphelenchus avenae]